MEILNGNYHSVFSALTLYKEKQLKKTKENAHTLYSISLKRSKSLTPYGVSSHKQLPPVSTYGKFDRIHFICSMITSTMYMYNNTHEKITRF